VEGPQCTPFSPFLGAFGSLDQLHPRAMTGLNKDGPMTRIRIIAGEKRPELVVYRCETDRHRSDVTSFRGSEERTPSTAIGGTGRVGLLLAFGSTPYPMGSGEREWPEWGFFFVC
jgi:hypothetical protein